MLNILNYTNRKYQYIKIYLKEVILNVQVNSVVIYAFKVASYIILSQKKKNGKKENSFQKHAILVKILYIIDV